MLDVPTLIVCNALTGFLLGSYSLLYSLRQQTCPGFRCWVAAFFLLAMGFFALVARGPLPVWLSIIMVHGCILAAGLLRLDGSLRFLHAKALSPWAYLSIPALVALSSYYYLVDDNLRMRALLLSIFVAFSLVLAGRLYWLHRQTSNRGLYVTCGLTLLLYGGLLLARGIYVFLQPSILPRELFSGLLKNDPYFLAAFLLETTLGICFLLLNSHWLERALLASQANLKVLQGILPICASCKKIRDESGAWTPVETYIHNHSEADFTHGMCPDCRRNFYPDIPES